jgi:molecular chaperone HscB
MDPFATLGLAREYDLDASELERRYRDLQRALHPDRHAASGASERRMSLTKAVEVNEAYRVLRDDLSRAEALLALHDAPANASDADPEFLMEMMELREGLDQAKGASDLAAVRTLSARVEQMQAQATEILRERFAELAQQVSPEVLEGTRATVGRLRYYRRFMDEVAIIEDEALG